MRQSAFFMVVLLLFASSLLAGDIRRIKKAMEKANLEKAEVLIRKSLAENRVNSGVKYLYSKLYFTPKFRRYSIDTATLYIRQAIFDYALADEEVLEEMKKEDISEQTLTDHLSAITSSAFERAKKTSNISAWKVFIDAYPDALKYGLAVDIRDSLAFQAIDQTKVSSLQSYLNTYPNSKYVSETQNILDRLLVSRFWQSKSLVDLKQFVEENPKSEYREVALRYLMKLRTISGEADDFLSFIEAFPSSRATTEALNFLYHLDKEKGFEKFDQYLIFHPHADSLIRAREIETSFQFAIFNQTFQLISKENRIITSLISINEEARCSGLSSGLVAGSDTNGSTILTKDGTELLRGELIRDLGAGFLLVEQESKRHVFHKSGTRIITDIADAEILNDQFLKIKRSEWALYSLSGLQLTEELFDDIFVEGDFWFFKTDNLLAISSAKEIFESFPEGLFLKFKFEDYELVNEDLLIGFRGDRECLVKSGGRFIVPWGVQHIYPDDTNGYVHDQNGYTFYDSNRFTYYPYMEVNNGFILRKEARDKWMLFSNKKDWAILLRDSVKLINEQCALITGKQPKLIFQNQKRVEIEPTDIPQLLSLAYSFTLVKGDISSVLNAMGNTLFSGNYDKIELLNDSLFSVSSKGKYGVINSSGNELLSLEFDYLSLADGIISFLKNQKIGMFDLTNDIQFDPIYESRTERLNHLYKARRGGAMGLVDREGIEVMPFEYEKIIEWTDSLVWAKQEDRFLLVDLNTLESEMEVTLLTSFKAGSETLMKFYGQDGFGLIAEAGILLKPIYSEIVWIGDESQGIIMADQALPEAGFHVVTYFDSGGSEFFSRAYSNEDFEKVLCER